MNIYMEKAINEIMVIKLTGRVDTFIAPTLREHFSQLYEEGNRNFLVDLSEVTFLDSAGLAALVQLFKRTREQSGDVKIILPDNTDVQRIFRLTKFDQVFDIHSSVLEATNAF